MLMLSGCDGTPQSTLTQSLDALLLEDARRCESVYTWPQELIDGLSAQLIHELQCMDSSLLAWYEPCKSVGCIWAVGPQPHAIRPEVISALEAVAASKNDYITIEAGYRDVAMQYYSRWFQENCNSAFNAAEPGKSNHQGGRAVDVKYYAHWWDSLLEFGFDHPIPSDKPHFELRGSGAFRDESEELKVLSVLAFQRLWNRNNPDDLLAEDGIYGPRTKQRLGASPVAGFPEFGCEDGPRIDPTPNPDDDGPPPNDPEPNPPPLEADEPSCRELIQRCGDLYPCPLLDGTDCFMPDPDPCRGPGCGSLCSEVAGADGCTADSETLPPPTALIPPGQEPAGCNAAGDFRWSKVPWFKISLVALLIAYQLRPKRNFYAGIEDVPTEDSEAPLGRQSDQTPAHWKMPSYNEEEAIAVASSADSSIAIEANGAHGHGIPEDSLEVEFQEALRRTRLRDEIGTGPEATDLFIKLETNEVTSPRDGVG